MSDAKGTIYTKEYQKIIFKFLFLPLRKWLDAGTVPASKKLNDGTVPASKKLYAGTLLHTR